jgi:membrane protein
MKVPAAAMVVWKALEGMNRRNGFEIAGYIAFTVMLSLFPFLIFLVSIAGFFGDTRTGQDFISTLSLFAPPDVIKTLQPAIQEVILNRSGSLLTIGLALALYSASSAVAALRLALDLAYGLDENRSFLLRKAQDFGVVLVGSIILISASAAIIAGPWAWKLFVWFTLVGDTDKDIYHLARYGFTLLMLMAAVMALHRVLPNARLTARQILPGALTTTILWIIAASALTLYFGEFSDYSATYGSLGGVIITLLFFYVSAIIFIFGGELNAALMAHEEKLAPPPNQEMPSLPLKA